MIYFTPAKDSEIAAAPEQDKKFARILYKQTSATITAASTLAGTDPANLDNPLTYSIYSSDDSASAEITMDFGSSVAIDSVCLVGDKPFTNLWTVRIQYFDGGSFVDWDGVGAIGVTDDNAFMFSGTKKATTQVKIIIDTSAGNVEATLRAIYAGELLIMERSIYGGHSPITLSRETSLRPNVSEGGQWLGRSQIRQAQVTSFDWQNLKAQWYRDNFDPFVESAILNPWFIAWKPDRFPHETAYCWTTSDIVPSNTGTRDLMSVSVAARGFVNDN